MMVTFREVMASVGLALDGVGVLMVAAGAAAAVWRSRAAGRGSGARIRVTPGESALACTPSSDRTR